MKSKFIFIFSILILAFCLIFLGAYIQKFSNTPSKSYFFIASKDGGESFDNIVGYYLFYDFEKQSGNISFRIIDDNISNISIRLPGRCNNEDWEMFDNPDSAENEFSFHNLDVYRYGEKEEYSFFMNLTCPGLSSNARMVIGISGNYTRGKSINGEHNGNPVFAEFKLEDNAECYSDCAKLEYPILEGLRINNFNNKIKIYSIRGIQDSPKIIEFYIKTYNFNWIFWSNVIRDIGVAILASILFYFLLEIFNKSTLGK